MFFNGLFLLSKTNILDPSICRVDAFCPLIPETDQVQIAWGRQSSNQPLRSQNRTAIDYYNVVLRHLPEPINGPNQPVLPYLQQSNYHAQNEPRWLQKLTNRWIRNVEAMMNCPLVTAISLNCSRLSSVSTIIAILGLSLGCKLMHCNAKCAISFAPLTEYWPASLGSIMYLNLLLLLKYGFVQSTMFCSVFGLVLSVAFFLLTVLAGLRRSYRHHFL